ncbi:STAS domain-containing protein [Nocardia sp. NBC_00508]|uniref:STAS domain-containing protein n=1 Tax=Nocardia sp. NBC_00508 TaxID=2975992 RepID=UPI002E81C8C2|nr:STAS domain-containing protein [Nocardia sp. NBC_00508]WUD66400.1 STAS domain-containing protein [Nocardia sp. NBC_00508]
MSAISLLREHAEGVHLNGSGPARRRDNRLWAQRVDRRRECVVVRVEGELDAAVSAEFFATVDRALQSPCEAVVIDLRAARFMSLRAAVRLGALRRTVSGGPDLRIVAGGSGVERALEVTGVRSLFPRYPSMRTALDA